MQSLFNWNWLGSVEKKTFDLEIKPPVFM